MVSTMLVSLWVSLEGMKLFTKIPHQIISGTKMMVGLSTATIKLKSSYVQVLVLGAWEQDGLPSYYKLKEAFEQKNIPAWFSEWGHDVAHDWEWWRNKCLISLTI